MKFDPRYNLWWPDFEPYYDEVSNHILCRVTDVEVAVKEVRTKGVAIQAGGHVGLFPRQLAKHFSYVFTFEAIPEMAECLKLNVDRYPNIIVENVALGAERGKAVFTAKKSGRSRENVDGDVVVQQIPIDSLKLPRCDLIYLDIEGGEVAALTGAAETIEKFRPVIAVEILKENLDSTLAWVEKHKYNRAARVHSDWIFIP